MTARPRRATPAEACETELPITTEEWHGWGWQDDRRPDLHIGPLPGRKQICLYLEENDGNTVHIRVLTTFRWPRDAYATMAAIDFLTGHRR